MGKKIKKVFPEQFKALEGYIKEILPDIPERERALAALKEASLWAEKTVSRANEMGEQELAETVYAKRLRDKGYSNVTIARHFGKSITYVRDLMKAETEELDI